MASKLLNTLRLSLEMTDVLADLERTGIKIDPVELSRIEDEYRKEMNELEVRLQNLNSADDRSMLFYSRRVKNKKHWSSLFNLGSELRGATRKPKKRTTYTKNQFAHIVKEQTEILHKTVATRCTPCYGQGRKKVTKKDGTVGKAVRVCKACERQKLRASKSFPEMRGTQRPQDLRQTTKPSRKDSTDSGETPESLQNPTQGIMHCELTYPLLSKDSRTTGIKMISSIQISCNVSLQPDGSVHVTPTSNTQSLLRS